MPVGAVAAQAWSGSLSVFDATLINISYLSRKEQEVYHLQGEGNTMVNLFGFIWAWNMLDIVSGRTLWWKRGPVSVHGGPRLNIQFREGSITVSVSAYL